MNQTHLKRGDIVLITREHQKIVPGIVFQNNLASEHSPFITLIPLSHQPSKNRIFEVEITRNAQNRLAKDCTALLNQITTLDKSTITNCIGQISSDKLKEIEEKALLHLGVDS